MYSLLIILASVAALGSGELFSSLAHLQTALYTERDIAKEIRHYIYDEQERLQKLAKLAEEFEQHSNTALEDPDKYMGNPVNAFLFVKHFTLDWDNDIDVIIKNNSRDEFYKKVEEMRQYLPTYEDLTGSVNALLRLQDTYKLETTELARGNVGGVASPELTAWDCFELGRLAYNTEDYYHTIKWMEEALAKVREFEDDDYDVNIVSILDYLAFAYYKINPSTNELELVTVPMILYTRVVAEECFEVGRQAYVGHDYYHAIMWMQEAYEKVVIEKNATAPKTVVLDYLQFSLYKYKHILSSGLHYTSKVKHPYKQGNIRRALTLTNEMLSLNPGHTRALGNKDYYEKVLSDEDKNSKRGDDGEVVNKRQLDEYRSGEEYMKYEALCRGEPVQDYKHKHKLVCRYKTNNHPLLILSPAKEEVLYLNPYLSVFHNSLSDREIEMIKQLATPKLGRATVHNPKTGKLETAGYRVSKSCWLSEYDSARIGYINDRIAATTGLTMDTAEELQVANYGIGGQYEPHFDFARKREPTAFEERVGNRIATFMYYKEEKAFEGLGSGNRIATFMFYMSDVQAGGATVFPYLGLRVIPEKGKAVFWYNLYKNGEGIYNTRHAACPVLVGSKWVSNKWIHERGQEFYRPCGLREVE